MARPASGHGDSGRGVPGPAPRLRPHRLRPLHLRARHLRPLHLRVRRSSALPSNDPSPAQVVLPEAVRLVPVTDEAGLAAVMPPG